MKYFETLVRSKQSFLSRIFAAKVFQNRGFTGFTVLRKSGFSSFTVYDLNFFKTGIAISLAHDGKTRGELAYELATMDNSEEEESVNKDANGAITSEQQSEKKVSAKRNLFFVSFSVILKKCRNF